ncbi:MAG: Myb-like DNA-binding domain containing protein [Candidatus Paraimprobicoccus trichonymphae]|uniref:Myb-like DNA-binding domain containing protein n=1 Tax=Candidatus Paraimprobicoccus trichonymphae TaxID=3033793 RepID=A0AA48KZG9_9FIRM|nr:MAG: Myb-like DNA-binding domain containing protein [Candidatus Paraimprobicoccus trichonymphae]
MKKRKIASFMTCLLIGGAFLGNVYGGKFIFNKKYDTILTNIIETHGTGNWELILKKFEESLESQEEKDNFSSFSIKSDNPLKQKIRRLVSHWHEVTVPRFCLTNPFSIEEDQLILNLARRYGPKWKTIKKSFPKRNIANIKNRFLFLLENPLLRIPIFAPNFTNVPTNENHETTDESVTAPEPIFEFEFPEFDDFFNDFFNKTTDESVTAPEPTFEFEFPEFDDFFNDFFNKTTDESSTTSKFSGFNEFEENFFPNL